MKSISTIVKNSDGFSLIDSMIALVILSIGLLSMIMTQVVGIQISSNAMNLMDAVNIAQYKMEEIMNTPYDDADLEDAEAEVGVFSSHTDANPPNGYAIKWLVDKNSPTTNMKTIKLNVRRTTQNGSKEVFFEFIKGNFS